jgi:diguanylate cyclase (GGDEF)-like protein
MPTRMENDNQVASEHTLAEHIRAERVRFVFIQSALPIVFSPLAAMILSLTLWEVLDHRLLIWWTAVLVGLCLLRIGTNIGFARAVAGEREIRRWERIFIASIMAVDLWWGFGSLLLLPDHQLIVDAVVFAFVMLMAGGHTASYSAHPFTVVAGVLCLTVPITVYFGLQPDIFHRAMAFVALMYVAASMRSIRTLGYFFGRTYRLAHELKKEKARAEELAQTDFLTGLDNRRAFYEQGDRKLRGLELSARPAALAMFDIDHFKSINDRYGHAGGDAAIRAVADIIRASLRAGDLAARLGGEEFALLLPDADLDAAVAIAERVRAATEALVVEHEGHRIGFTISAGVAALHASNTLDGWIAHADAALYRAKQEGRNRVVADRGQSNAVT